MADIYVIPFKHCHYHSLLDMLSNQKCPWMSHIDYKTLPKIGYVAMRDATIVAACFLRRVEGGYGQLDTLATNPYLGSKIRNEAINLLFDQLIGDAEELELVGLMVITEYASMIDRFQHRGFTKVNQTLIIKKL